MSAQLLLEETAERVCSQRRPFWRHVGDENSKTRLDDSTGCAARFAHLICCERRGWLQPAAANVNMSTFVLLA